MFVKGCRLICSQHKSILGFLALLIDHSCKFCVFTIDRSINVSTLHPDAIGRYQCFKTEVFGVLLEVVSF
jgi:hypothetical protein